jgi:hypothetical protein
MVTLANRCEEKTQPGIGYAVDDDSGAGVLFVSIPDPEV